MGGEAPLYYGQNPAPQFSSVYLASARPSAISAKAGTQQCRQRRDRFSCLGEPAVAGITDWYENAVSDQS